jgi:hypothetical protein
LQLWVVKADQRVENLDLSGCAEIDRLTRYLGPATYLVDATDTVVRELEHRPGVLRVEPISGGTFQANDDHVYEITDRGSGYSQTR